MQDEQGVWMTPPPGASVKVYVEATPIITAPELQNRLVTCTKLREHGTYDALAAKLVELKRCSPNGASGSDPWFQSVQDAITQDVHERKRLYRLMRQIRRALEDDDPLRVPQRPRVIIDPNDSREYVEPTLAEAAEALGATVETASSTDVVAALEALQGLQETLQERLARLDGQMDPEALQRASALATAALVASEAAQDAARNYDPAAAELEAAALAAPVEQDEPQQDTSGADVAAAMEAAARAAAATSQE